MRPTSIWQQEFPTTYTAGNFCSFQNGSYNYIFNIYGKQRPKYTKNILKNLILMTLL